MGSSGLVVGYNLEPFPNSQAESLAENAVLFSDHDDLALLTSSRSFC